ncbi:hypothetical protein N7G274_001032 [Stereocaulon virgatum]|uniref:RING-type domain-containing protein n=1 Tax=Stereocaulon virgatum TaxID=373712 RepID=A0ABR4AQU2_9LECA
MSTRPAPAARISSHGHEQSEEDDEEHCLALLNESLCILATIFPHILPEVFRELLSTFDGESRLQIAVEQLLRHQDDWVKGRWRTVTTEPRSDAIEIQSNQPLVAAEDEFRRASYKWATRSMLYEEFKVLSRSKIEGVLAEENYCYTRARPTLQKLASKSWRNSFNNFLLRWRKPTESPIKDHWMMIWPKDQDGKAKFTPILKETGDTELDAELQMSVLTPFLGKIKKQREANDWEMALAMNDMEARHAGAIYECECCFLDTNFEQMATCTTGGHVICFRCIWHAVSEAIFGQSWGRNIDHHRCQIKCLAPTSTESCDGCIPQSISRRAILQSKGGKEALTKLESRLADEAILKAQLPLLTCPFCNYAEVDELYFAPLTIRYRLNTNRLKKTFSLLLLSLILLPLLLLYTLLCHLPTINTLSKPTIILSNSLTRLLRTTHHPHRFQCRSPTCSLPSCLTCHKIWRDPHTCHESATLSLRTTIEAARTAALKRTCPRCGLAFIKDSGCNKLTCVCGYAMCYICRQGLGKGEGGEGYRHFCQHFRPAGGQCRECDRCDLYRNEDDEGVVRRAGAVAEKEWREREGMIGVQGLGGEREEVVRGWWEGEWTLQGVVDWWVEGVLVC